MKLFFIEIPPVSKIPFILFIHSKDYYTTGGERERPSPLAPRSKNPDGIREEIPSGGRDYLCISSGEEVHIKGNEEDPQHQGDAVDHRRVISIGADGIGENRHVRHSRHACLHEEDLRGHRADRNERQQDEKAER